MGERDLDPGRRILDDAAETVHLRTRDPRTALERLYARDQQHVFLEGGPTLASAFLRAGLVDEVVTYVAPMLLGSGRSAVDDLGISTIAEALHLRVTDVTVLQPFADGDDTDVRLTMAPTPSVEPQSSSVEPQSSSVEPQSRVIVGRACRDHQRGLSMFTGIVEELGTVEALERQSDAVRLSVRATTVLEDVALGDSISVNGCCLTVVSTSSTDERGSSTDERGSSTDEVTDLFTADVMAETLDKTGLGALAPGDRVNLERAVTAGTRLGGHLVQGHVDAVGRVVRRDPGDHWDVVTISLPPDLAPYLVDKGSITVDGVSLTVVEAGVETFSVSLIPETMRRTTLGFREPGDLVNLEVDVIGKYVARQLDAQLDARLAHLRPSEGTRS